MAIKSITILEAWRVFAKDEVFEFTPGVNLLVGDQGCGKSSLLSTIAAKMGSTTYRFETGLQKKVTITVNDKTTVYGFDFETHNPRTKSVLGPCPGFQIASKFTSHGETAKPILSRMAQFRNAVVFLDEPDTALSPRSILGLKDLFAEMVENGCQIIAAVHNPLLILAYPQCLSLDSHTWVESKEFLKSHGINLPLA
jgi:predicted ATPase